MVVRLADVNDNAPRLSRHLWAVEVDETSGAAPPDTNLTLLQLTATDRDTANYFYYRVGVRGEGGRVGGGAS